MTRRGRPLSLESMTVIAAVAAEPMPSRAIADTLHMPAAQIDRIACSLLARGYLEIVAAEPVSGRRPVNVYGAKNWVMRW